MSFVQYVQYMYEIPGKLNRETIATLRPGPDCPECAARRLCSKYRNIEGSEAESNNVTSTAPEMLQFQCSASCTCILPWENASHVPRAPAWVVCWSKAFTQYQKSQRMGSSPSHSYECTLQGGAFRRLDPRGVHYINSPPALHRILLPPW